MSKIAQSRPKICSEVTIVLTVRFVLKHLSLFAAAILAITGTEFLHIAVKPMMAAHCIIIAAATAMTTTATKHDSFAASVFRGVDFVVGVLDSLGTITAFCSL